MSQWQRLLKNQGVWQGSFTRLAPDGTVLADTPSQVSLLPSDDGQQMRQVIRQQPAGAAATEQVLEYRSLGRGILLCEDGAFSNGSMQWGPFSDFGAELGLIWQDERLRLAQIFAQGKALQSLTLIRERRAGVEVGERSPLQISPLLGTWQGTATTLYPDYRPETTQATTLTVEQTSPTQIQQTLTLATGQAIRSSAQLDGDRLRFSSGPQPVQVLLLPNGASSTCPTEIQPRQPLFLELGWLVEPHLRLRLVRRYDSTGAWESLTHIVEQRQASPAS